MELRADWQPQPAQGLQRHLAVQPLANVPRREPVPDDVAEVGRDVIERLRPDEWLVARRQHRQARPEAGAEDPDAVVPLRCQPPDGPSRIEHRLAADLERAHDVGADDIVGAREFGRHARVVVRQAQAQCTHAKAREQPAQPDVALLVGVPLGQHEHGAPDARRPAAAGKKRVVTRLFSVAASSGRSEMDERGPVRRRGQRRHSRSSAAA